MFYILLVILVWTVLDYAALIDNPIYQYTHHHVLWIMSLELHSRDVVIVMFNNGCLFSVMIMTTVMVIGIEKYGNNGNMIM